MTQRWATEPVPKRVVISTRCDECRKEVPGDPEDWVSLRSEHSDWGNDSVESGDAFEACSWPCLVALLQRIKGDYDSQDEPTLRVWISGALTYPVLPDPLTKQGGDDGR